MQAIMETIFNVTYLTAVLSLGIIMIKKSKFKTDRLFAVMAIVLGTGDAFHLIPRSYALFTTGLESNAVALGVGKFITSISMTVFYGILYLVWRMRYKITGKKILSNTIYLLAIIRILICFLPQNDWLNYFQPVSWGIYRNLPFAIMGFIILILFYIESNRQNDSQFKFMWLAIVLSFGFYIPVVLWAKTISWIGVLMIPKTLAYVWIVYMGYSEFKRKNENNFTSNKLAKKSS